MSNFRRVFQNERGLSLIEVVASIVIIGIIFISFFGLFIQSGKTAKTSEKILDATYVAQREMEKVYQLSKSNPYSNFVDKLTSDGYTIHTEKTDEYTKKVNQYDIHLKLSNRTKFSNLRNVLITVYDNGELKTEMENIYKWKVN